MPIYEYRCTDCRRRSSIFVRTVSQQPVEPTCEHCGGKDLSRLISTFAVHRTESDRLGGLDTSSEPGSDYYGDNRNIGLWAKKRLQEMGATDMVPQLDEIIEKGRSGDLLKEYEAAAESRDS